MLGKSAPRWILLTLLTACGEQGYAVTTLGRGGAPVAAEAQPSAGAPARSASDAGPSAQPTEVAPSETTSGCSGSDCSLRPLAFNPNDPYRQRRVLHGNTPGARNVRSRADCAGLGPDTIYELDLSAFSKPVSVYMHVRADFDASLAIETGRDDDPFLVDCNEDHALGGTDAFIAATLEPKQYRIVVDGEGAHDSGAFELTVELPSPTGRCGAPPPNDGCKDAVAINPDAPIQTFFGTTECASDQAHSIWECGPHYWDRPVDVFYSLDLTRRTQPALVHASTRLAPTKHDTVLFLTRDVLGECAEPLTCADDGSHGQEAELWAKLEPGRYFLGVESYEGSGDFGLSVEIAEEPCVVANDTCQTAQVIEPRLGTQTLVAWPGCGDDSIVTHCNILVPTPDIFYRLDLRAFEAPVHVRVRTKQDGIEYDGMVLMADDGVTCRDELYCGDIDLWLAPASYYLALDGLRDQLGPVELTVELDTGEPPPAADCIDESVATCARTQREYCCVGDGAECSLIFLSCGLRPEALECLCAADPDCCGGDASSTECQQNLEECGTFCDDFDPILSCPG